MGLTSQIVVQKLKSYDHAQGQDVKGMANSGQQQGGKVVFKKVVQEDIAPQRIGDWGNMPLAAFTRIISRILALR